MSKRLWVLFGVIGFMTMLLGVVLEAAAADPVKIGIIATANKPWGMSAICSARLGVDEINQKGGILGRPIKLIEEDSKGEMPKAVASYRKLTMDDRVKLVIMAEGTELTMASLDAGAETYPEFPHINMSTGSRSDAVVKKVQENLEKYYFFLRLHGSTKGYMMACASPQVPLVRDLFKAKKVAILYDDADWTLMYRKKEAAGVLGVKLMKDLFTEGGMQVVYEGLLPKGQNMFLPLFELIAGSGAEYIETSYVVGVDQIAMGKQWPVSACKDIPFTFSSGAASMLTFMEMTNGAALGSLVIAAYPKNAVITETTVKYQKSLKDKYNIGVTWMSWGAYEAPFILKEAAEKIGNANDVKALINTMLKSEFVGARGIIKFGEFGYERQSISGYPYITEPMCQWQGSEELIAVWPQKVQEMTNPGRGYIPPTKLREMAKKGQLPGKN